MRHGVGIMVSSASCFQEFQDLTSTVCNGPLFASSPTLNDGPVCFHVAYAPEKLSECGNFFRLMTTVFEGVNMDGAVKRIVVGDFSTDNY